MKKADATKLNILEKAFELIYIKGYQATSIDDIIATTNVTKGAFYYHFKNKDEMGLSIINELLKPTLTGGFIGLLQNGEDPLNAIYDLIYGLLIENEFLKVEYGCPASNLTHEMSPLSEDFNNALNELTEQWIKTMIESIELGKHNGVIRADVDAMQVTMFVMSGYWGIRNFGKLSKSKEAYVFFLKELRIYLENLR
ncbi:TetR/AcrR family transcriptional regulator [Dyadobacter linearis]|nr:TetR/AcrR family transcriptional regulator [Dyadobacter sp. CECT 9623]